MSITNPILSGSGLHIAWRVFVAQHDGDMELSVEWWHISHTPSQSEHVHSINIESFDDYQIQKVRFDAPGFEPQVAVEYHDGRSLVLIGGGKLAPLCVVVPLRCGEPSAVQVIPEALPQLRSESDEHKFTVLAAANSGKSRLWLAVKEEECDKSIMWEVDMTGVSPTQWSARIAASISAPVKEEHIAKKEEEQHSSVFSFFLPLRWLGKSQSRNIPCTDEIKLKSPPTDLALY